MAIDSDIDIIILPLPRYDGDYSSTIFSLASEFSKTNRTFYLDNPVTLKDISTRFKDDKVKKRWHRRSRKGGWYENILNKLFIVYSPIVLPINFLPRWIYPIFRKFNSYLIRRRINATIQKFNIEKFVFINSYNPLYDIQFSNNRSPLLKIYHCVDNIEESVYIRKHGVKFENKLISAYDLTVVTSTHLHHKKEKIANSLKLIPNAADTAHFSQALTELPVPANMKALQRPIICYVGNIERRMDFSLLVEVAKRNPEMTFMMVGPVNEGNPELNAAKEVPNIKFTGPQPFDQIPAYLKYSDCSIIPFKINDLTQCIYPLKINEYLAAGKAVVSTPFSPDILSFSDVIEIAKDPADFSESIKKSLLKNDTTEVRQRVERASGNDWQSRAAEFLATMDAHL